MPGTLGWAACLPTLASTQTTVDTAQISLRMLADPHLRRFNFLSFQPTRTLRKIVEPAQATWAVEQAEAFVDAMRAEFLPPSPSEESDAPGGLEL